MTSRSKKNRSSFVLVAVPLLSQVMLDTTALITHAPEQDVKAGRILFSKQLGSELSVKVSSFIAPSAGKVMLWVNPKENSFKNTLLILSLNRPEGEPLIAVTKNSTL